MRTKKSPTEDKSQCPPRKSAQAGRPKSSACATCKRRKIKCDLARPACSQCVRGKWTCPGYAPPGLGFHNETPTIQQRYAFTTIDTAKPGLANTVTTLARHPKTMSQLQSLGLINGIPTSPSIHLASLLVSHLDKGKYGSYTLEALGGQHLVHLPSRIGHSAVLDSAVRCLCVSHAMFLGHIGENEHLIQRLHLEAIKNLKVSLSRPNQATVPETLGASMLLRSFESLSLAPVDNQYSPEEGFLYHTRWVWKTLQQQAAVGKLTALEMDILRSSRGAILVEAMNGVKPCTLDSAPWNELLMDCDDVKGHNFLYDQYALWPRLVQLPRLIHDVVQSTSCIYTDRELVSSLLERALDLHKDLDLSHFDSSSLDSCHSPSADLSEEMVARAYNFLATTNYVCVLTATVLLIDRLILFLGSMYYETDEERYYSATYIFTEAPALRDIVRASYAWWKEPSPAAPHSKQADLMFSACFEAVDLLDGRGTWEDITNDSSPSDRGAVYDLIALYGHCNRVPDLPQDSLISRSWTRTLFAAMSKGRRTSW